jgi:general secretion pathway protein G
MAAKRRPSGVPPIEALEQVLADLRRAPHSSRMLSIERFERASDPLREDPTATGARWRASRARHAGSARPIARAFTLLELLVVMVIIGLLAGLVAPRYFAQVGKSQVKVARAQIDALDKALDQFRLDVGRYPTAEEGLQALVARPGDTGTWSGPYLKKGVPMDPWGRPYLYQVPGTHGGDFDLLSYGKDGRAGGTGEDADLGNW